MTGNSPKDSIDHRKGHCLLFFEEHGFPQRGLLRSGPRKLAIVGLLDFSLPCFNITANFEAKLCSRFSTFGIILFTVVPLQTEKFPWAIIL